MAVLSQHATVGVSSESVITSASWLTMDILTVTEMLCALGSRSAPDDLSERAKRGAAHTTDDQDPYPGGLISIELPWRGGTSRRSQGSVAHVLQP